MTAFLAIVGDTWRLARRQAVLYVLIAVVLLAALVFSSLVTVRRDEGGEKTLCIRFNDSTNQHLEVNWYAGWSAVNQLDRNAAEEEEADEESTDESDEEIMEKRLERIERSQKREAERMEEVSGLSAFERSVQGWAFMSQMVIFTIAMWFFIAACAGYFPGLMESGAIDVVLAKPVSRLLVFAGRFAGGLVMLAVTVFVAQAIILVSLGLLTGIWHARIFMSLPLLIFVAGLVYAVVALIGITWRSSTLALLIGYFLYLGVDTGFNVLIDFRSKGMLDDYPRLSTWIDLARDWVPNFGILKALAATSVLATPTFPWRMFGVASAWFAAALGLGYFIFRRRDF